MNEIFLLSDMDAPVVAELRDIGVRVHFRAEFGSIGMTAIVPGTSEWTPEFPRRVDDVLVRHGLQELGEGVWGPPDTDRESLRLWEKSARTTAEYQDLWQTMTEHPEWSDQEVAEATGAKVDDVAYYRAEWEF